jgi:fatty acid desaturase
MWGIHIALDWSMTVALLLALPTAGLIVRTFILMHDCAHGSFFASRALNNVVGFVTGVLTLTPFAQWRRDHALHHASSGDLDRRGHGDVPTLTVREYLARSPGKRRLYRLVRHPAALLLGGPFHLAIGQRLRGQGTATGSRQATSVWSTNVAIALMLGVAIWAVGWTTVLFAYGIPYYVAAMAGVWLFYVQHQFEDAYWAPHDEWEYVDAALRGSSYLRRPAHPELPSAVVPRLERAICQVAGHHAGFGHGLASSRAVGRGAASPGAFPRRSRNLLGVPCPKFFSVKPMASTGRSRRSSDRCKNPASSANCGGAVTM